MSDRMDLIARIGACLSSSEGEVQAVLRDALAALVEDHGVIAATERRKSSDRTRKRRVRSTDSVDSADRRDVTVGSPLPPVSLLSPTPPNNPSFPPPPQPPAEPSADELRLLAAAPEASEQVRSFLDGMPFARRLGWVTVLLWVMDEGPRLSGAELRKALGDFTAKVVADRWTPTYFRGFCRGVRDEPSEEAPSAADAGKVFAAIRSLIAQKQSPGRAVIRYIPRTKVEELGARAVAAYEQVGGADRFLDPDEKIGFLLRDFTNAFQSAA